MSAGAPELAGAGRLPVIRSMLFVPGDRDDRIPKALATRAECVVVDLEDAVARSQKARARERTVAAIGTCARPGLRSTAVRVNSLASGLVADDLAALSGVWDRLDLLVLPMTSSAEDVRDLVAAIEPIDACHGGRGPGIVALVETAAGILAAPAIAAAHPRVHTLALGPADLAAQLGLRLTADGVELQHARSQLVFACGAAGLPGPVDGPWLDLDDTDGLLRSARAAKDLGFGGKQLLHPRHLDAVTAVFAPTEAERQWAREVDAAFGDAERNGVASIRLADGSFVDYPVAQRARALLHDQPAASRAGQRDPSDPKES